MNQLDPELIRARIREVAHRKNKLADAVAGDVAFHMTDWLDDLGNFSRFCADPHSMSNAEVSQLLTNFLIHVPNHLAATSKLYTGIPVTDIFKMGATSEE